MTSKEVDINIYDITYPCYVAGIPVDSQRIIHIPGSFEYKYLEGIASYVVEGYKTKDKIYLFDVIPYNLWVQKVCKLSYEKRLKAVRQICTAQIADFSKVIDLDTVKIDNPHELTEYCENLLTLGHVRARILAADGHYVFGESNNGELLELKL